MDSFHRELGKMMWDYCGMSRNAAGLERALGEIRELREEFWHDVNVLGSGEELNQSLEKAGRVADFFELAELMCLDALDRNESCGGHFREEYQTPDGEAQRDDDSSRTSRPGSFRATASRPRCTKSRCISNTCIPANGATSNAPHSAHLAAEKPGGTRRMVRYEAERRESGHVVPGNAGRAERRPDRQGRGADGVRPRLPRGHLRHVRLHDQRRGARPAARHHGVPAHMRHFKDGDELYLEPWRAKAFPVIKDLVVDRSAFDRIIAAGGYITVPTGSAPDGNAILVPKENADRAMDAAACIGCGACVAACPNASAALFTGAKIAHLGLLPQGQPERHERALRMVAQSIGRISEAAPTSANAKRCVRRRSSWKRSRG